MVVRNLQASAFHAFHEMQADHQVMQYTSGQTFNEKENLRQLEDCIARYSIAENDFWVWAVTAKSTGEFLGTCAIVPNLDRSEIGYRLLRRFFGNGYGQEICDGLIDFAIARLKLDEIVALVDTRNVASVKILDRSQLTLEGEAIDQNGQPERFYRWRRKILSSGDDKL